MKFWIASILLGVLIFLSSQNLYAQMYQDVVHLKNGGLVRGIIIEQIPNVSVKIQTVDGNIFVFKMEEIEKITKELPQSTKTVPSPTLATRRKNPVTAAGLSCVGGLFIALPGLGQFYNEEYDKGILFCVAGLGGVALMIHGIDVSEENEEEGVNFMLPGLILYSVAMIWATLDAYESAQTYTSAVTVEPLSQPFLTTTRQKFHSSVDDYSCGICLKVHF